MRPQGGVPMVAVQALQRVVPGVYERPQAIGE